MDKGGQGQTHKTQGLDNIYTNLHLNPSNRF